jgi:3-oxoacyl-[acyl-carrier protein] reductase
MDLQLAGRNCIVTGASRGIGRAIALGLAAEGAHLAICARGEPALQAARAEIEARGVRVFADTCDLADADALRTFLAASHQALGGVDILIHNASALAIGPDMDAWNASLQVDLLAAVRACEQVVPWMAAGGGGSILFISSISGIEASPATDFGYTAAKSALIAYAKKLSLSLAAQRIRVNALAPGSIDFPDGIWSRVKAQQPAMYEMVRASIPWGRLGTPQEVADVAVYLVSARAGWVTGECVAVDGGQHRGIR